MKKLIETVFVVIVLCLNISYGQQNKEVDKSENSKAIDSLRIIEKVYIHTDRDCYYPGDDIWFKAYLIEASNRILSNHSGNLYVELISPVSKIIVNRVIRLDAGLGNGDFELPDSLKSGRYRLRAYTNYMRNFSDHLFFNKEIVVINPTDSIERIPDVIKYVKNKIDLSFFPEGGSLVDNVSSVVAFKAVNAAGKGYDVSGEIYSSAGDFITRIKSTHLGMGSFILKPAPGLSYYSTVKDTNGIETRSEIPKSFPTGVTLSASINRDNKLLIIIRTNPQTLPLVLDHDLLLSFSTHKKIIKTTSFKLKSFDNSFILPIDDLPDGIVMMTLSTPEDLPLSERLIYIQKDNDFRVSIEPDKLVYKKRDSVEIMISFSTGSGILEKAFLSLSAVEKSFTDNTSKYPSTISSWFLLESDIHGPIEEPSYYFDPTNGDRMRDLDLLLLTQGWRDFEWKYNNRSYYPPEVGFTVSGRIRKGNVNKPLEDSKVNIGLFDNKSSIVTTIPVDSSGRFRLDGIDFTGEGRLIVSAISNKGNLQGLVLLDSLKYIPEEVSGNLPSLKVLPEENRTTSKQEFDINETIKKEYEIKETIRKKYKISDTISLGEVSIIARKTERIQSVKVENARKLYGKPDNEILITPKMMHYQNVFELLTGRVSGVRIVDLGWYSSYNDNGIIRYRRYTINIRGQNSFQMGSDPLILIDGVKKSQEDLLTIPVSYIDRIDVLKSAGTTGSYGMFGANGVISIITKSGDVVVPDKTVNHSVNINISGYEAARVFYSPQHSPSTAYQPDLRTTLFWKPNIKLQSNRSLFLNYFNADNPSTIRIIMEGITTTGIPITARTEYEVK
jgi:hypothetical protein